MNSNAMHPSVRRATRIVGTTARRSGRGRSAESSVPHGAADDCGLMTLEAIATVRAADDSIRMRPWRAHPIAASDHTMQIESGNTTILHVFSLLQPMSCFKK